MECGLGLYNLAFLHLLAHSLYKAHAFLGAGGAVQQAQLKRMSPTSMSVSMVIVIGSGCLGLLVATCGTLQWQQHSKIDPATLFCIAIAGLAIAVFLAAIPSARSIGNSLLFLASALGIIVVYFGYDKLFQSLFIVPANTLSNHRNTLIFTAMCFALLYILQGSLRARPLGRFAAALYPWFYAGLYLDELFTRATFRLWPARRLREKTPARRRTILRSQRSYSMNSIEPGLIHRLHAKGLREAVETACKHIAPTWPLDQFIAVNPDRGFIDAPIHVAASRIQNYCGSPMLMPRSFFRQQLQAGSFSRVHLQDALGLSVSAPQRTNCSQSSAREPPVSPRIPLMTAMADARRDLLHGMSICDFVTHNVSQHCAWYFDCSQATWEPRQEENLYRSWLSHASADMSPWLLMGIHHFRKFARTLPSDPMALIEESLIALPVPPPVDAVPDGTPDEYQRLGIVVRLRAVAGSAFEQGR